VEDQNKNFVFIGGTKRGFCVLNELILNSVKPKIVFILKEDSHEILKYSEKLTKICKKHELKYFIRKKLRDEDYSMIGNSVWDFGIVCGWRTIINPEINEYFKIGLFAAHDSLLPKYRGFAPINWCIINGEKETGVTLFKIVDGDEDSGPIVEQEKVKILESDYAIDVYDKIISATSKSILNFIENYKNGELNFKEQNEENTSYCCARSPEDGKINFNQSSKRVYNFIRALAPPYPGAFLIHENQKYTVTKVRIGKRNHYKYDGKIIGRVISISKSGIEVLCENGTILIKEWLNNKTNKLESPQNTIKSIRSTFK
tara:strand:+ start:6086 stop:7030 length:945 start_codon:yes stop_codon:yes gene_type:complete